jgi:transposase-like protein
MMTEQQRLKVAELKAAAAASVGTRQGAPREVRTAVVALRWELRQAGVSAGAVAEALGIHVSTLYRWEREVSDGMEAAASRGEPKGRGRGVGFRMVKVAASTAVPMTSTPATTASVLLASRGLRVAHAPSGLVVDGLDVETLAALLRRMS